MARRHARAALAGVAAFVVAAGCGGDPVRGTSGAAVAVLEDPAPPPALLDLAVAREDVAAQLADVDDQYVDASALYSLRKEQQVKATLQVSRFGSKARVRDSEFREGLATNLGGQPPITLRVGEQDVLFTQGNRQKIAVWYRDDLLFILTSRDDYDRSRGLLREAVSIGARP